MDIVFLIIMISSLVISGALLLWNYQKNRALLSRLHSMLNQAIDGSFQEASFDESQLSALETRMNQYLSECTVSARNLQAEKDKINTLISDISHQTKTPIANLLLYSQLLSEQELSPDGLEIAASLTSQAEKLNFLIASLVKASRLETGIIAIRPRQESVQQLLDAVLEQMLPKVKEKNMIVDVIIEAEYASFDRKWMTEAILNLFDNAVKYSSPGSKITATSKNYELFCRIDIKDEGIGIAEDEISKVFTRFYRSQTVSQQEGVGIGLYLAREIIAANGGYIKAVSKLGAGTTFSVFLPCGESRKEAKE